VGVDAASRITLEAGHQARPLDWHGQLISIQHPADIYDPGRNTCSGKFELQSNASLAVQKEVMRAKPHMRRGSVEFGFGGCLYGSPPGLGPRAMGAWAMRQSLKLGAELMFLSYLIPMPTASL
jgi:hypothetical protein